MSDDRSLERRVTDALRDEAPVRGPDRLTDSAARHRLYTGQVEMDDARLSGDVIGTDDGHPTAWASANPTGSRRTSCGAPSRSHTTTAHGQARASARPTRRARLNAIANLPTGWLFEEPRRYRDDLILRASRPAAEEIEVAVSTAEEAWRAMAESHAALGEGRLIR